ncbi:MAG: hypothetical protein WC179_06970 [Candidatus Cloacimonadaceae bacterium]
MINFGLFLIAFIVLAIFWLPLLLIQIIRLKYRRDDLGEWFFNLAVSLDYLGATLLYGTVGHTVSAITYKKATKGDKYHKVQMKIINFLFRDDYHCEKAYEDEYNN